MYRDLKACRLCDRLVMYNNSELVCTLRVDNADLKTYEKHGMYSRLDSTHDSLISERPHIAVNFMSKRVPSECESVVYKLMEL